MRKRNAHEKSGAPNRRDETGGELLVAGTPCREGDIEEARGVFWVAKLFRILAGLLLLLAVLQVFFGLTNTVEISYGLLAAEAIRLVIFAGLLWGAGDLAELFVQSHDDLRASRILLARINHKIGVPEAGELPPTGDFTSRGRGDATH